MHKPAAFRSGPSVVLAVVGTLFLPVGFIDAAPLPVPSGVFVTPGSGRAALPTLSGRTLNIRQWSPKVTLNWDSFNIAAGNAVNFQQPNSAATALNLIHDANPSVIRGKLTANGEVWLLNDNGILFGRGAQVDVRGLLASSLAPTANALAAGIAPSAAQRYYSPAFSAPLDGQGKPTAGNVTVESGARIETNGPGGRVMLFAPEVSNQGTIIARDGQVALAAGSEIYILQPEANGGSGLIVEVGQGGIVTNGSTANAGQQNPEALLGQIIADRGTATLVGLSVNQLGRVTANAAVRAGGTIRLLARESVADQGSRSVVPVQGGTVVLGPRSVTAANPDATDTTKAVDASSLLRGNIAATGKSVLMQRDSSLEAHGGTVRLTANDTGLDAPEIFDAGAGTQGRIAMAAGSRIDVSGTNEVANPDRNLLEVKLQGAELKDRPVQRDGALRGKTVIVDLRKSGTLADGTPWVGTPLADLTKAAAAETRRTNLERNSVGGTVSLLSQGSVLLSRGSEIDVSGGHLDYPSAPTNTTMLFAQGRVVDIADADPLVPYAGLFGEYSVVHQKWGPTDLWRIFSTGFGGGISPAYQEGKDAGQITVIAPSLVLDGDLRGGTTPGLYQRKPTAASLLSEVARLGRPFDQLPRPGKLQVGLAVQRIGDFIDPQYLTPDVEFSGDSKPRMPAGFDPQTDPLAGTLNQVRINTHWFGAGRLGVLDLYAEGQVRLDPHEVLDLGPGGVLSITGGDLQIGGSILAPAGKITLLAVDTSDRAGLTPSTGALNVRSTALIDVSGLWTNDRLVLNPTTPTGLQPLLSDAGSIDLAGEAKARDLGGLYLAQGSQLRADGGGSVNDALRLTKGKGGTITLSSRPDLIASQGQWFAAPASLQADVSAYSMGKGGTLSVNVADVCISADCGARLPTRADFLPGFFTQGGFSQFKLGATGGSARVLAGTSVSPRQLNLLLNADFLDFKTGSTLREFSTVTWLPDFQRLAANLSLSVKARNESGVYTRANFGELGTLEIGRAAQLLGDAGAHFQFSSDTRLAIDGTVSAPAGTIDATLTSGITGNQILDFLPGQTLWLGDHAQLLARGVFIPQPSSDGSLLGTVQNGGTVNLAALSGYLVGRPRAVIDVGGTSATLDILDTVTQRGGRERRLVGTDGGAINFLAAEGIFYDGAWQAGGGTAGARDGALSITLDPLSRGANVPITPTGLPTGPRVISVEQAPGRALPAGFKPGDEVPAELNGYATLEASQISKAGLGDLTLRARTYPNGSSLGAAPGEIGLGANVDMTVGRRLVLDASTLNGVGAARLAAPYVAIGNTDILSDASQLLGPLSAGSGVLTVNADLIDLLGFTHFNGWRSSSFLSTGDLRLVGLQILNQDIATFASGGLETTGNVNFTADQVYPTTLSHYTVAVKDNPAGVINILPGGTAGGVYSVGGSLTLQAPTINQGGVLKAPLGTLNLAAERVLNLLPKSLTSSSLDGITTLFGRVELGSDWVYEVDARRLPPSRLLFTRQLSRSADPFPTGKIRLQGDAVNFRSGATVDQSGGGDLLAYEFQPGINGSTDLLANGDSYAVVPLLGAAYAPYDPQEQRGFSLQPGENIELSADTHGLKAGRYALLPAHYALLPGAYLVTPVAGYQDIATGSTLELPFQGTLVAGRRVSANGLEGDSRTGGYLVRNAGEIATLGAFTRNFASTFKGLSGQSRPQDAGALQIAPSRLLDLSGTLSAAAGSDGRGGRVEISGVRLAVVPNVDRAPLEPGTLLLGADDLSNLRAPTLLLGGTTSGSRDSRTLSVTADSVALRRGARVVGSDIILAATDLVSIAGGASLSGTQPGTSAQGSLNITGDGALVRVTSGEPLCFTRLGETGAQGRVSLAAGSTLAATGATLIDASAQTTFNGTLDLAGTLNLGASRISLGTPPGASPEGLVLPLAKLAALQLDELVLSSRSGIDLYGNVVLDNFSALVLDTPGLAGYGSAGATATLGARRITLTNGNRSEYLAPVAGPAMANGSLTVSSDDLILGTTRSEDFRFVGFDNVRLEGRDSITAKGASQYLGDGALKLSSLRIGAAGGADLALTAASALELSSAGGSAPAAALDALGGSLRLSGRRVLVDTQIETSAGQIVLSATGATAGDDIQLTARARLLALGRSLDFGSAHVAVGGGDIRLVTNGGDINAANGAVVDVSGAAAGGDAGSVALRAPNGSVTVPSAGIRGAARKGYRAGSLELDVGRSSSAAALGNQLAALSDGGFQESLRARLHTGDLELAAGRQIAARIIDLSADAGAVVIGGTLDASSGVGGKVRLSATDEVLLEGRILANSSGKGERGGLVEFQTAAAADGTSALGGIRTAPGSLIAVNGGVGGRGGRVYLRAPRASIDTVLTGSAADDLVVLGGSINGESATVLEGFRAYGDTTVQAGEVGAVGGNVRYTDAQAFMLDAANLKIALGAVAAGSSFHVRPGVEIRSADGAAANAGSDLALNAIWDLSTWRFNGEPGVLTLRAAGNLDINDILSDGFVGTSDLAQTLAGVSRRCPNPASCSFRPSALPKLMSGASWDLRLVAGADLGAADSLAVTPELLRNRGGDLVGNLTVAGGTPSTNTRPQNRPILNAIRTGTGSIDLATGGNLTLMNRAAVIYTAGLNAGNGILLGTVGPSGTTTLQQKPYPEQGGDVRLAVGGNLNGVDPTLNFDDFEFNTSPFPHQVVSSWLLRQGNVADNPLRSRGTRATGWTVGFEWFEQGIGALGGGQLEAVAGGDFYDISLSVASSGKQIGGTTAETSVLSEVGGGRLLASAGGDIRGGVFYVGRGSGDVRAGGDVRESHQVLPGSDGASPLYPVLVLGDSTFRLAARGTVDVGDVVNPTFIPQGPAQRPALLVEGQFDKSYFSTYSPSSGVTLSALSGDVVLHDSGLLTQGAFENALTGAGDPLSLRLYPAALTATSFLGNVVVDGAYTLQPSARGNLALLAGNSVRLNQSLTLPDIDPARLPNVKNAQALTQDEASVLDNLLDPSKSIEVLAPTPLHLRDDGDLARIVARSGDVESADGALLFLSRSAEIRAGRDLFNLNAIIENVQGSDVSVVAAGQRLIYLSPRLPADTTLGSPGALSDTTNQIAVWGPGRLLVTAGSDFDLGTAGGIVSRGNEMNPALAGNGAHVTVFAGLGKSGLDFDGFIAHYFTPKLPYLAKLTFEQADGRVLSGTSALAALKAAPVEQQAGAVLDAFFNELRLTGREAAKTRNPDYSRGYEAIKSLLPGKDYAGNLSLNFSQIFTIKGGNIDLFAPGGDINVGLATPPSTFGIDKQANQLGIVTEGSGDVRVYLKENMDVNESRVFAADGGDILVWSNFGDIDAGRGARSAISVPANGFQFSNDGKVTVSVPPPIQGSGIRALTTTAGRAFGNVDLFTPRGVVNASEAGIQSAGNITIAAVEVLGAENIKAGGTAVGVPVSSIGSIGASVGGASGAANAASRAATDAASGSGERGATSTPMDGSTMSIITVEFLGFGA